MLTESRLRRVLPTLPTTALHGPWFRVVDYAALQGPPPDAPLDSPAEPLWPGGPTRHGARFTPRGGADAIYLASDPLTAFIETYRLFIRPSGPALPAPSVPSVVLTINGVIADALDLTDHVVQHALRTNLSELTGEWRWSAAADQEPPTHLLGRVAHEVGGIHAL